MTAKLPASLWMDLLGLPFCGGGRGPDAYDCVGLLLEIERRLDHPLPPYTSQVCELELARACWEPVADPMPGDAILIRSDHPRWHIGVVTEEGWMIHAFQGRGVARERYNSFPWLNRIEGFYRWKQV